MDISTSSKGMGNPTCAAHPTASNPSPPTPLLFYDPPPAHIFTLDEIRAKKSRLTRQAYIHGLIEHPVGALIEYPQSGSAPDVGIGHIFNVDLNSSEFTNPRSISQYSLGEPQGYHRNVTCLQLRDSQTDEPVVCLQKKSSCQGIKQCSFNPSPIQRDNQPVVSDRPTDFDAAHEVFTKTLGFFCALIKHGCLFDSERSSSSLDGGSDSGDSDSAEESGDDELDSVAGGGAPASSTFEILLDCRSRLLETPHCNGKMHLFRDKYGQPFIQCVKRRKGHRAHLKLRNLKEFDIDYLEALLNENGEKIKFHEALAQSRGYGPLLPCSYFTSMRDQKMLCPSWHRDSNGILKRGTLTREKRCSCRFEIYCPYSLEKCPKILLVSRGPHSHPDPPPFKTPKPIIRVFHSLLDSLSWRLADATPRRVLLDSAFMNGLRDVLSWPKDSIRDPTLVDLHPSFGNLDLTERLINTLRDEYYPNGTGFNGAIQMVSDEKSLPLEDRYVRCAEEHDIPGEGKIRLVICMYKAMSELLLDTKRPSIDTSFKRLHQWQEFEIEAWFPQYQRSIVIARAFTTSQSGLAHQILFCRIFEIAQQDTGRPVQFRHIHGSGFETFVADGHKGQALGLGYLCVEICKKMTGSCPFEPDRLLNSLDHYEHLARFYRYCFAHYVRNVAKLRPYVTNEVYGAMMSLASSEPLHDFDGTLALIRKGGKKAVDWLKDKEKLSPFAIPALYQPKSKIPLEIWKASPSTSNGNEQAHRNINRDGTKLTLLAGIHRGRQYDARAQRSLLLYTQDHISPRDQAVTHFRRFAKAITRTAVVEKRRIKDKDETVLATYRKILKVQTSIQKQSVGLKRCNSSNAGTEERAIKRLRTSGKELLRLHTDLEEAQAQASGNILTPDLYEPNTLLDSSICQDKSAGISSKPTARGTALQVDRHAVHNHPHSTLSSSEQFHAHPHLADSLYNPSMSPPPFYSPDPYYPYPHPQYPPHSLHPPSLYIHLPHPHYHLPYPHYHPPYPHPHPPNPHPHPHPPNPHPHPHPPNPHSHSHPPNPHPHPPYSHPHPPYVPYSNPSPYPHPPPSGPPLQLSSPFPSPTHHPPPSHDPSYDSHSPH